MLLKSAHEGYVSESGGCRFRFLPTGDIAEFSCGTIRINCYRAIISERSPANIWLRVYKDSDIAAVYPLWGSAGNGEFMHCNDGSLGFSGIAGEIGYRLAFLPMHRLKAWVWRLELDAAPGLTCDVIYGQDIGVAERSSILNSELYCAQYLGHQIFDTENGFAVGSRQNMAQGGGARPCLQQGMLVGQAVGYSTDAMQFLGLDYKAGRPPHALWSHLENRNYQFEQPYIALQSGHFSLDTPAELAFYGLFQPDHPEEMTIPLDTAPIHETLRQSIEHGESRRCVPVQIPRRLDRFSDVFSSAEMGQKDIDALWPRRELEEQDKNGRLLSFFTPEHTHVVLQAKELLCERPHGHIIMSVPDEEDVCEDIMASTSYMVGIFNAQTVIGNTIYNKLVSVPRGLLNQMTSRGQRLWVDIDGKYRLLGLPAAYEMGLNWARWHYLFPGGDRMEVLVYAAALRRCITMKVGCHQPRDILLTTALVMGVDEFDAPIEAEWLDEVLRIRQPEQVRDQTPYPGLHYDFTFDVIPEETGDDGVFFEDGAGHDHTLHTCTFLDRTGFEVTITGALEDAPPGEDPAPDFYTEQLAWIKAHENFTAGLQISAETEPLAHKARQLDHTAWWFAYDALVHFASPHGLEQTGGAAWGTRDVCQGPVEFFMAGGHFKLVRNILLRVFTHQTKSNGEWPQWFMFDKYPYHHPECHGDVIFWPLKSLAEYLQATGDFDILQVAVPWLDDLNLASLTAHLDAAFDAIEARLLPGTNLVDYAGGDWDDTLQPASAELRRKLVSSWTQALAVQTMDILAKAVAKPMPRFAGECRALGRKMADDFKKRLTMAGVTAGLARVWDDGTLSPLLHPSDTETGIHFRLLPLIRGVIAGIVTQKQADASLDLIAEHLYLPDGAHLMDRPVRYSGGNSRIFLRAEQATNVGREVGLMYTHAHIRYIEALAKSGRAGQAWDALFVASPVAVCEVVPNAMHRQANVYFSSSDALFMDRYEFQEGYAELRAGEIPVRGGWRLYSSGPGIWWAQFVSNVLCLRLAPDGLDSTGPVLPPEADGITVSINHLGKAYQFTFRTPVDSKPEDSGRWDVLVK